MSYINGVQFDLLLLELIHCSFFGLPSGDPNDRPKPIP